MKIDGDCYQRRGCKISVAIILAAWLVAGILTITLTLTPHYNTTPWTLDCGYGTNTTTFGMDVNGTSKCVCDKFYKLDDRGYCSTERKSFLTASFCQTFFGFVGAGFAYIGAIRLWLLNFFLGVFALVFWGVPNKESEGMRSTNAHFYFYFFATVFWVANILMWWITAGFMWGGYYNDGYNLV